MFYDSTRNTQIRRDPPAREEREGREVLAVGNNELGHVVDWDDKLPCPKCGKLKTIAWATDPKTKERTNMLGCIKHGKSSYLVVLGGKYLPPRTK